MSSAAPFTLHPHAIPRNIGKDAEATGAARRTRYTGFMRSRIVMAMVLGVGLTGGLAGVGGCADPGKAVGFGEADPAARMRAACAAAADGEADADELKGLVAMLDSDDPAERVVAIGTLEGLTGQTLGYDHAATEPQRRAAVDRWAVWVREREAVGKAVGGGSGGGVGGVGGRGGG